MNERHITKEALERADLTRFTQDVAQRIQSEAQAKREQLAALPSGACPECGGEGEFVGSQRATKCEDCNGTGLAKKDPPLAPDSGNVHSGSDHLPASQALQAGDVGGPGAVAAGGERFLPPQVYALGVGVTVVAQGQDLALAEGAFELEACGRRLVFNPLAAKRAHRSVAAVKRDVAAIGKFLQAEHQKQAGELGGVVGHGGAPLKTVIVYLPGAYGKTTHAETLRARFGCTHVVDEWNPNTALTPGALHLTNAEVATC